MGSCDHDEQQAEQQQQASETRRRVISELLLKKSLLVTGLELGLSGVQRASGVRTRWLVQHQPTQWGAWGAWVTQRSAPSPRLHRYFQDIYNHVLHFFMLVSMCTRSPPSFLKCINTRCMRRRSFILTCMGLGTIKKVLAGGGAGHCTLPSVMSLDLLRRDHHKNL